MVITTRSTDRPKCQGWCCHLLAVGLCVVHPSNILPFLFEMDERNKTEELYASQRLVHHGYITLICA